jgi:hypothetical protein
MKTLIFILFLFSAQIVFSQEERIICGTLKDKQGEPLIGVSIIIKGSTVGTISDVNGKYCIKAPLGAVLIYSFIGFTNREVTVTSRNSQPVGQTNDVNPFKENVKVRSSYSNNYGNITYNEDSVEETEGTAYFTLYTPSYSVNNPNYTWLNNKKADPTKINSIDFSSNVVKINLIKDEYIYLPRIDYVSTISVEKYSNLPDLQNIYTQGRPVNGTSQWRGPETGEMFSWGPAINNLENDGTSYPFDKNGRITLKGLGNGKAVIPYNSKTFFRNGATFYNSIKIYHNHNGKEYGLIYNNKYNRGIVPKSGKTGNYLEIFAKRTFPKFKLNSRFIYDKFSGNMMSGSPGLSNIMYSVLSTPPTFDNANGLSTGNAAKNSSSYYIPESFSQRSYAPGSVNNPYWLVNNITDNEKHAVLNFSVNTEWQMLQNLKGVVDGNLEYQNFKNSFTYPAGTAGVVWPQSLTRSDGLTTLSISSGMKYSLDRDDIDLNSQIFYNYKYSQRKLTRTDIFLGQDSSANFNNHPYLRQNNMSWLTSFTLFRWLPGSMSHNITNSNIYNNYTIYYSPTFSIGVNFHDLLGNLYPINILKIRANWGYSFSETPLAYTYGSFDFLDIPSNYFTNAIFSREVTMNYGLQPEKLLKKNVGIDLDIIRNIIGITFDMYENKTYQGIYPVIENDLTVLKNIADYRTRGIDAELSLRKYGYWNRFNGSLRFIFSSYRSKVTHLENNTYEVPLAGFTDIHTSLIEGQPKAILVGTAYLRDDNSNLIIGNDGFPLVDNTLQIVGDPNPDYNVGLEASCNYKTFSFNIFMEYRKGGDMWNGTENVLSYHGLSMRSVEARNTREYIFHGVKEDGTPNTTPVDFANPSSPFETNRWYRYGKTGVAEGAIQDASMFRVKEVSVSYLWNKPKMRLDIALFVRNPLLISKYRGIDPDATLWGKANAVGLDLFNFPTVTSTGVTVKVSI